MPHIPCCAAAMPLPCSHRALILPAVVAQHRQTKKHHAPAIDRRPEVLPPIVVAVVGPPQVGKTTLIRYARRHPPACTPHTRGGATAKRRTFLCVCFSGGAPGLRAEHSTRLGQCPTTHHTPHTTHTHTQVPCQTIHTADPERYPRARHRGHGQKPPPDLFRVPQRCQRHARCRQSRRPGTCVVPCGRASMWRCAGLVMRWARSR